MSKRVPKFKCEDFDIDKLTFSVLDKSDDSKFSKMSQWMIFPKYKYDDEVEQIPIFTTGVIKFVQYGVPKLGSEYVKTDNDRTFIRVPLDESQPACVNLDKMFSSIDEYFGKQENAEKFIGSDFFNQKNKPVYTTTIREPIEDEDGVVKKGKNQVPRMKSLKFKLNIDFNTKAIETLVFDSTGGKKPVKIDNINTVSDLTKYFGYNCSARFVVMINKAWVDKKQKDKNSPKSYGITMKILQIEIIEEPSGGGVKDKFNEYAFDEGSSSKKEEEDDEEEKPKKVPKKIVVEEEEDDDDDEENEDTEEEDESEEVEEVKPVKSVKGKKK